MSAHRITYDVLADGAYRATCRCGKRRESTSTNALSSWGPAHVIDAYEQELAISRG